MSCFVTFCLSLSTYAGSILDSESDFTAISLSWCERAAERHRYLRGVEPRCRSPKAAAR